MNVGGSLIGLGLMLAAWGTFLSAIAVIVQRSAGSRWVWRAAVLFIIVAATAATISFRRSYSAAVTVPGMLYTAGVLIGIPTLAIAFACTRAARRGGTTWQRQLLHSLVAYVLALPIAAILGVIPDLMRFIGAPDQVGSVDTVRNLHAF